MVDIVDQNTRSRMMSGIRGKNTKPEMLIRKALFKRGYRYKTHDKSLPGKPDLVFPRYKKVINIHGCFWHCHDCHLFTWPKSRKDFWIDKIESTVARDKLNYKLLKTQGWLVLTVWECSLKGKYKLDFNALIDGISDWLKNSTVDTSISGK